MATRFYLSTNSETVVSPAFAGWARTIDAERFVMSPDFDNSAIATAIGGGDISAAADTTILIAQFVSPPMVAGIAFTTSDTVSMQVQCAESGSSANVNREPICIKVYSQDGATLRATLKALGHYGASTTEWVVAALTNRTIANAVVLDSGYTTVAGDRLVLECGAQIDATGGSSIFAGMSFGDSSSSTDLGVDETDNTSTPLFHNPWFEISRDITFAPEAGMFSMAFPWLGGRVGASGFNVAWNDAANTVIVDAGVAA